MEPLNFSLLFDPLSLFFLAVIFIVSFPSAIYSVGYMRGEFSRGQKRLAWLLLALFVLSMCLVVTAGNVIFFLVFWEIMSLVSYFLVIFDSKHEKSIQAGLIYIVMTHVGTAFLTAAFLLMYKHANSFDLLAIKYNCQFLPQRTKDIIFLLLLAGFGTKAGVVPLHIWLPYAHPQAPSHVSSVMSGAMIKTAIYGLVRFGIYLLGPGPVWWGQSVLALAVVTCLVGIIYALMERDLKKLLAYSSVENMGMILLGVGLGMLFMGMGLRYLSILALIAGLYHLINHAIFKGLLFLCAGSVYRASGTRDMEKLGGLIRKMPYTAACFLVGAMAISALPPLNGFVSEWLTLQAFFQGAFLATGGAKLFLGFCAAMLALTGGLAVACFVKAFGITFLAMPRSRYAENAGEVSLSMKAGMAFLAGLTLVFGLAATAVMKLLAKVASSISGIDVSEMSFSLNNLVLAPQPGATNYLSAPLLAIVLISLAAGAFVVYMSFAKKKSAIYNTWDCGYYKLDPRNEYTATAFSKPLRIAFGFFLLPYRKTQKIRESFYHVKHFAYETHTTPVFKKFIYEPMVGLIFNSAKFMRKIQPGSIHLYLAYIFCAALALIIFTRGF